jgi:hypothetical protein
MGKPERIQIWRFQEIALEYYGFIFGALVMNFAICRGVPENKDLPSLQTWVMLDVD